MKCRPAALLLLSCFGYLLGLGQQPAPIWNADGKYGVVNSKGQVIVPFEYDYISSYNQGLAIVAKNKKKGLVDVNGKMVIPVMYEDIYH